MVFDKDELRGKIYTVEELANLLGVPEENVRKKIRAGHIRASKPAGSRRQMIEGEEIIRWLLDKPPEGDGV